MDADTPRRAMRWLLPRRFIFFALIIYIAAAADAMMMPLRDIAAAALPSRLAPLIRHAFTLIELLIYLMPFIFAMMMPFSLRHDICRC